MRIPFIFFLLMIICASCELPPVDNSPYLPSKQSLANDVRARTAFQLKREKGLIPFGTAGQMMDEIKMLGLSFQYYKEINIEEARELLMKAGSLLIKEINANELIRPYLDNYPFEAKNIEIKIFLFNPNGTQFDLDKLHYATMVKGKLKYVIRSSENNLYKTIYTETYEEAVDKLGVAASF
jgi:hypothetical protein